MDINVNIGDVFERDGKRREVVGIDPQPGMIHWRRPGKPAPNVKQCWCVTWQEWVAKAKLVKTVGG